MKEKEKFNFLKEVMKHPVGKERVLSQSVINDNFQEKIDEIRKYGMSEQNNFSHL